MSVSVAFSFDGVLPGNLPPHILLPGTAPQASFLERWLSPFLPLPSIPQRRRNELAHPLLQIPIIPLPTARAIRRNRKATPRREDLRTHLSGRVQRRIRRTARRHHDPADISGTPSWVSGGWVGMPDLVLGSSIGEIRHFDRLRASQRHVQLAKGLEALGHAAGPLRGLGGAFGWIAELAVGGGAEVEVWVNEGGVLDGAAVDHALELLEELVDVWLGVGFVEGAEEERSGDGALDADPGAGGEFGVAV